MTTQVKYPEIEVELIGNDGNAFSILGAVKKALRKNNVPQDQIDLYFKEATAGDYDNLLQVTMQWVTITGKDEQDEDEEDDYQSGPEDFEDDEDDDEQDDYGYGEQKNFD